MSQETETDAIFKWSSDPLEVYNMTKKRRGLALIFNYANFDFNRGIKERFGSQLDAVILQKSLKGLGFEVRFFTDLKLKDIRAKIDEAAQADHSDADCFLAVFMSHGDGDHIHTYDGELAIMEVTDKFKGTNCKSLVGKPKIFIWQACRGQDIDQPCDATNTEGLVVEEASINTVPAAADFIMCYSVAKGYCSIRDTRKGSWYIQDLCEQLQKHGNSLEFTQLLTVVNAKVAKRGTVLREKQECIDVKQIPCFASMLTKQLYFRPKQ